MNKLYQIVPWFNSQEWHDVYENLYSTESTICRKKKALDMLNIWKARCPIVPSGIESTLCLLEVFINDVGESNEPYSDQVLRLAYATALMRFVNHMLDKESSKGTSLYKAAKDLGMPDWIVDLRHDTAHSNKLPPIERLREAALVSLEWLKEYYWDKYKDSISDYISGTKEIDTTEENKIAALLNFCISLSICSHSKCNIKYISQIPDPMKESLVNEAIELFGKSINFSNLKRVSISELSDLMYRKAKKLLNNESALYVNKTLLSEDSLFLSLEVYDEFDRDSKNENKSLSKPYVQCFEGLLNFLHTHDFLQDFIKELINIISTDSDTRQCKLAAQWVSTILQALKRSQQFIDKSKKMKLSDEKDEEQLKILYYHWYPSEKNNELLLNLSKPVPKDLTNINYIKPIVSSYNPYLTYFVRDLLSVVKPQIPSLVVEKICNLADLIAFPDRFTSFSSKIYTAEDIKMGFDNGSHYINDNKHKDNATENAMDIDICDSTENCGIWKLPSREDSWSACPIGKLPWENTQEDIETIE